MGDRTPLPPAGLALLAPAVLAALLVALVAIFAPDAAAAAEARSDAPEERAAQPEAGRGKPASGQGRINALVFGRARSPVLAGLRAELGERLRIRSLASWRRGRRGLRGLRRFQMLIVDGDEHGWRRLRDSDLIRAAANRGLWVLALDTNRAHRHRGLAAHTAFRGSASPRSRSRVYLFRREWARGTPRVRIFEIPDLRTPTLRDGGRRVSKRERRRDVRRGARRAARSIAAQVGTVAPAVAVGSASQAEPGGGLVCSAEGAAQENTSPPPEALHFQVCYAYSNYSRFEGAGYWVDDRPNTGGAYPGSAYPAHGPQTTSWTVEHIWDVFLQNDTNSPQGNNQLIAYRLNAITSPKQPGETFVHMDDSAKIGLVYRPLERSWWTSKFEARLWPDDHTSWFLQWVDDSPANANNATTVSVEQSFDIGFSTTASASEDPSVQGGVNGSYTWSYGHSYALKDWAVRNGGAQNARQWLWHSNSPCDTTQDLAGQRPGEDACFRNWSEGGWGGANTPNDLSLGELAIGATAYWITDKVRDGTASFMVDTPIEMIATYCDFWGLFVCFREGQHGTRVTVGPGQYLSTQSAPAAPTTAQKHTLDLGAVIPVGFSLEAPKVVTVSKRENFAKQVSAAVVLDKPAPWDLQIKLWGEGNAVEPKIGYLKIPKGARRASFPVLIDGSELSGGRKVVNGKLGAFYTQIEKELISVKRAG